MSSERIPETGGSMINSEYKPWENTEKMRNKGLKISQHFSTPGVHPFDEIEWEKRQAKITDETGKTIFEQKDAEVPDQGLRRRYTNCAFETVGHQCVVRPRISLFETVDLTRQTKFS